MPLLKILTDPQNFKFYAGGQGSVSNSTTFGQKSIRYGNDRFNSANSGQPYITVGIPDNLTPGTTDFLQRGGINVVRDTAADVQRITKMFTDLKSPNGLLFTAKQQLLSRTAPRTQTSGLLNEGVYSPLNTLAQVGVVAFGGHLKKQGISPFARTGANSNSPNLYYNAVKPNPNSNQISLLNNRLLTLWRNNNNDTPQTVNGITYNPGKKEGKILLSYSGGPDSFLGIGPTNIFLSQGSRTAISLSPNTVKFFNVYGLQNYTYSSLMLASPYYGERGQSGTIGEAGSTVIDEQGVSKSVGLVSITAKQKIGFENIRQIYQSPSTQDFRKAIRSQLGKPEDTDYDNAVQSGITPEAPNYANGLNFNIDNRTNQGMPGQRANKSYAKYDQGVINKATNKSYYSDISLANNLGSFSPGLDIINSTPVYRNQQAFIDSKLVDIIPFRIAIIDNDAPNFKTFIHFRAFIDSMSDSYNADWSAFKYLGRGENFYTYQGFTRQISLSWTVAAQSKQELIPMYKKLNYLASSLTPDYSPNGYMRGNLVQLTIGGYLYEQPGIITSLTYDVPEESPWEIGIDVVGNTDGDKTVKQLPHIIRVTGFNFIPIQQFRPSIQSLTFNNKNNTTEGPNATLDDIGIANTYGPEHYISLANDGGNNYTMPTPSAPPVPPLPNLLPDENLLTGPGPFS